MQPLAESYRQRKHAIIRDQNENIPCSVNDGGTMAALRKMRFKHFARLAENYRKRLGFEPVAATTPYVWTPPGP